MRIPAIAAALLLPVTMSAGANDHGVRLVKTSIHMPRVDIRGFGNSGGVLPAARIKLPATLEELNGALMFLGGGARRERAEILPALRTWIDLARIQPVLASGKFPDHVASKTNQCPRRNGRHRSAG